MQKHTVYIPTTHVVMACTFDSQWLAW